MNKLTKGDTIDEKLDACRHYSMALSAIEDHTSCIDNKIEKLAQIKKIDLGRWFSCSPPKSGIKLSKIASSEIASTVSKQILNIPCYWTMTEKEIISLQNSATLAVS